MPITCFDATLAPLDDEGGDQLIVSSPAEPAVPSRPPVEGILADALANRLLSIPGGRQDAARIPDNAEGVEASAFSHTAGAEAPFADAGGGTSVLGDDSLLDAGAPVTEAGIPIISQMASLGRQATARASYSDPVKRSIQVTNMRIQLLAQPTYSATNSVNIVYGTFSGTVGWTSTSALPEDFDVVTLTVRSFTPYTTGNTPNGNDYSYDAVMDRFAYYAGVRPSYITAQSTGSECSVNSFYNATAAQPCELRFLGRDVLGLDGSPRAFVVSTTGVSVQFSPWYLVSYDRNSTDSKITQMGHKGSCYVSPQTYVQMPGYVRPGYELLGWSASPTATTATWRPMTSVLLAPTANMRLYAVWSKYSSSNRVTLSMNDGSGDAYKTLTLWYGRGWYETTTPTDSTLPLTKLSLPTKIGFACKGFSTSAGSYSTASYWIPSAEDEGVSTDFPAVDDADFGSKIGAKSTTLYAVWRLIDYTITYDPDGGTMPSTVTGNKGSYTIYQLTYSLPRPTKTGYAFKGWTVTGNDAAGHDYSTGPVTVLTSFSNGQKGTWGDLTCKANWEANAYDVTFNANGGEGGQATSLSATYDEAMPTPVASPTREGYRFLGWYDKADYTAAGAKQYYSAEGASLRSFDVDGPLTLYAAWGKKVGFWGYANGGALMYSSICRWQGESGWYIGNVVRCIVNEDLSLTTIDANGQNRTLRPDSENTDKRLVGWGTSPIGPLLSVGERPTSTSLDLYAIWEGSGTLRAFANGGAVKYAETCKWDGDGYWVIPGVTRCVAGEDGSLATTDVNGTSRVIVSDDGERVLLGWGTSPDGPALAPGTYVLSRETALYAIWSEMGEVGRYPNGGALMYSPACRWSGPNLVGGSPNDWRLGGVERYVIREDAQVEAHSPNDPSTKLRVTGADPDATDRKLLGWSRTATGPLLAAGTYGAIGYVPLYAVWDSSTLSFDANGGTGGQSDQVTAIYGEAMPAISTEKPVRTGYSFMGWYDAPDVDRNPQARLFYSADGAGAGLWDVGCDLTLYAGWEPNAYKVLLDANGDGAAIDGAVSIDAKVGEEVALPTATRYGYAFQGWAFDAEGTQLVPEPAFDLATGEEGDAEVTLYARWALVTDVELPVAAASVSFELGVPDGTLRVAGSDGAAEAEGWLRSAMPVEVALDSVSCQAPATPGQGAAEEFWARHGSYADLTIRPNALVAAEPLVLSAGTEVQGDAIPGGFSIPAATSASDLGERRLLYGLSLDRLFADAASGGAGVDILDLLPTQAGGSFALPTRLYDVVFTVDVTKYA